MLWAVSKIQRWWRVNSCWMCNKWSRGNMYGKGPWCYDCKMWDKYGPWSEDFRAANP